MSIDEDFIIVEPEVHASGDGSPRQSGEERDSLLQAHSGQPTIIQRGIPAHQPVAGSSSRRAQQAPGELGARPAALDTLSSTNSGTSGSSTEMSSLGSIVPNSRFSALSPLADEQRNIQRVPLGSRRGQILSLEEQRRVEQEMRSLSSVKEEVRPDSELLPLPPPPRSVDTQHSASRLPQKGSDSSAPHVRTAFIPLLHRSVKQDETLGSSNRSSTFYDPEDAALITAERVKGVRPHYYSSPEDQNNAGTSGGILSSISSRLSWFKNLDSLPRRRSATPKSVKLSDKDSEADQALLSPISDSSDTQSPIWSYPNNPSQPRLSAVEPKQSTTHLRPYARLGFVSDAERPESGISGRSGASSGAGTTYFDAYSTFPNTPVLTPLPRALTPAPSSLTGQPSSKESSLKARSPLAVGSTADFQTQGPPVEFGGKGRDTPPTYDENDTIAREHSRELASREGGLDILDLPVPSPLSEFRNPSPVPIAVTASTSTAFSNTNTVSSATAPTLFTQTEGSLSTSTSQSSFKDSSNETAGAGGPKPDRTDGSGGTGTGTVAIINMVHVPQTGQAVFATKEKMYAAGQSSAIHGSKNLSHRDNPTALRPSKEAKRSILSGTIFAGESQKSIPINSVDMLEDEPPLPGEGWRSLANVVGGGMLSAERRFTLGTQLSQRLPHDSMLAELGALHAMRSHLSPVSSNRSTGSAPASRREMSGSTGSWYSQPSGQHSLNHSGSISSSEGRLRYPSSFRYGAKEGSSSSNGRSGGAVSPALSAFGNKLRKQASDEIPVPRNLTPLSEQHAYESGSSYYTAPSTLGSRKTAATQDSSNTFRSATTVQSAGAAPALMEIEEDVVDAARRAAAATRGDIEFGLLSPRSQASELSTSVSLSSAPWATGLDQNWMPL